MRLLFLLALICCTVPAKAASLVVAYNNRLPISKKIAQQYQQIRGVAPNQLLPLTTTDGESISYTAFQKEIAAPIRKATAHLEAPIIVLLCYGLPLKINKIPDDGLASASIAGARESTAKLLQQTVAQISPRPFVPAPEQEQFQEQVQALSKRLAALQQRDPTTITTLLQLSGWMGLARDEAQRPDRLSSLRAVYGQQLLRFRFMGATAANQLYVAALTRSSRGLLGEYRFWLNQQQRIPDKTMTSASVDSELSLVHFSGHAHNRWLANPWHEQYDMLTGIEKIRRRILLVCRLDGPDPEQIITRLTQTITVEQQGLTGTIYLDARGKTGKDTYSRYDRSLRNLATKLSHQQALPVVFDDREQLLADCPDAALYCGWYSLARYRDVFRWQPGAVGYHIASSEATTLRRADSTVWCKRMLEEGVAATLGPVAEPYLASFPEPDRFFTLLLRGRRTLIEVYYRTLPYLSWRQVLVGDPLYRPFAANPVDIAATP